MSAIRPKLILRPRLIAVAAILTAAACSQSEAPASAQTTPAQTTPAQTTPAQRDTGRREVAVFAGGCFWSVESNMEHIPGVVSAVSGYAGGTSPRPTYEAVEAGNGYVEAVQVTFDPGRISYRQLVDRFWRTIDPTDARGQFCDTGPAYGTAVFATSAQKPAAEASRQAAMAVIGARRFTTPVRDAGRFWPAEAYHQDFARLNPARYAGYSRFCGRAARLRAVWGA
ncbi:peptide-methionine (S)-S-oxide reductase MsrA [Brevundimonas goettingensis]|uniref:Peptide methionine sulfoxide reductase MsrA n=1 Tax=Brevundimonas goettingensis TaxID=2774190 RepID=A0A975C009_9CAUL|nr:peptide-methionine (S)-S-oxide reductase MsrA [Brevundimonas goettingensis]QTC91141.1 peptide-methionine (S)-S-oxide reductase MsrA [Brevundimonas goettingensis]